MKDEQKEYERDLEKVKKALDFLSKQEGVVYIFSSLLVPKSFYEGTEKAITANVRMLGKGDYEWTCRLLQACTERLVTEGLKNTNH